MNTAVTGPDETTDFLDLLEQSRGGNPAAWASLVRVMYADLRRIAHRHGDTLPDAATLSTTALINESYLRLADSARRSVTSRAHFLNLASRVMRQVVCDYARERLALKRGAGRAAGEIAPSVAAEQIEAEHFVLLDEVLRQLADHNARWARVFECRFFAGLSDEETALALDLSLRTAQREWSEARRWLAERLDPTPTV